MLPRANACRVEEDEAGEESSGRLWLSSNVIWTEEIRAYSDGDDDDDDGNNLSSARESLKTLK